MGGRLAGFPGLAADGLTRALQSSAIIAPADLPDLETYLIF